MRKAPDATMLTMVSEFHSRVQYDHEKRPNVQDTKRLELWAELLEEEHQELLGALKARDIYGVADGIADSLYVLIGAALAFAIPIDEVFQEVHKSNLSKISDGVIWREDGKVLRGKNYRSPDVRSIVNKYIDTEESR